MADICTRTYTTFYCRYLYYNCGYLSKNCRYPQLN